MRPRLTLLLFVLMFSGVLCAQGQPASDPQAVALASQSITALTGGTTISDVTLAGSVSWTIASDTETGTAVLSALGTGESRMDLTLASGTRTEIRDASTGTPLGQWITQDGASGMFADHNCRTDPVWFFPAVGSLAAASNVVLSYIGQESRNGAAVQHIQSYIFQTNPSGSNPSPQQLSTMDFYLDVGTLLPVAIAFNSHPDNDPTTNIPVEIDFSNYQSMSGGVGVPAHIQEYFQGTLMIDLVISSASFNTGLSLSNFSIN